MKNRGKIKFKKRILIAVFAPLVAFVIGFSALIGIISAVGTRMRTDGLGALGTTGVSATTINLGESGITDQSKVNELITYLGGSSYADLESKLTAPKPASEFLTKTVTLGGIVWNVMYVSKADYSATTAGSGVGAKGDVIVTMVQAGNTTNTKTSRFASKRLSDVPNNIYPASMYGSSLVRSYLVGSKYTSDGSTLTAGAQDSRYAPFTSGAFSGFMSTPAQMAWQETQSCTATIKRTLLFPNEAWGTPSEGVFSSKSNVSFNYANNGYSDAEAYAAWKDDKIWLPSMTEMGWGDPNLKNTYNTAGSGLWNANATQRSIGDKNNERSYAWLRSGSSGDPNGAYSLLSGGTNTSDYVDATRAVRPAIHLNLKAVVDSFKGSVELGATSIDKNSAAGVKDLISYLGANSYNDLAANLSAPRTADNFTTRSVKMGGVVWDVMYVSKADYTANGTSKGDIVVTLWQKTANASYTSQYSPFSNDVPNNKYPPAMYGASLVRSKLVGSDYVAVQAAAKLTAGTQDSHWAPFTSGNFAKFMATPANMAWQEVQDPKLLLGYAYHFPNDSWGTVPTGGDNATWYIKRGNDNNFADNEPTTYSAWKNDKIWLPSMSETGWGATSINQYGTTGSGLWNASAEQRATGVSSGDAQYAWLRSGNIENAGYSYHLNSIGAFANNTSYTNKSYSVRPAIHLNLSELYRVVGEGVITPPAPETHYSFTVGGQSFDIAKDTTATFSLVDGVLKISYDNGEEVVSETITTNAQEGYEPYLYLTSDGTKTEITSLEMDGNKSVSVDYKLKKFTVKFEHNMPVNALPEGVTNEDFTIVKEYNSRVNPPAAFDNTTRPAYLFGGWFDNPEFSGTAVDFTNGQTVKGDKIYYAKWELQGYQLTLHYDEKGEGDNGVYSYGTEGMSGEHKPALLVNYTANGRNLVEEYVINKAENIETFKRNTPTFVINNPTAEGFKFTGWYDSEGNLVDSVWYGTTEDIELWGRWEPVRYRVTFNAQGGTVSPSAKYYYNTSLYTDLPAPTRTGYDFENWYTSNAAGQIGNSAYRVTSSSMARLRENITLYANWTPKQYEIFFENEEGIGNLEIDGEPWTEGEKYDYGQKVTIRVSADGGYKITALWIARDNQDDTRLVNGSERTIISDLTIRAEYAVQTYNITYTYDGGAPIDGNESGFIKKYTLLTEDETPLPDADRVYKKGYDLSSWTLKNGDSSFNTIGGMISALQQLNEEVRNVVLIAKWNPGERSVFLHKNIGGVDDYEEISSDHGVGGQTVGTGLSVKIQLADMEAMDNYTLLGWATSPNSRSIAVPVDENGVGYYTVKAEDPESNTLESSLNQLYAVWHVRGQQMPLIMGSDAKGGATEVTYTGVAFHITAQPMEKYDPDGGLITLRYQWFKNGKLVETVTKSSDKAEDENWTKVSHEVKNVADSGVYTCILTVTGSLSGDTSSTAEGEIEVVINKTDYTTLEFNNKLGVGYDGLLHTNYVMYGKDLNKTAQNYIEIGTNQSDWIKVTYTYELDGEAADAILNAGTYTVTAHFTVPANSNYNDIEDQTSIYEILPVTINNVRYEMYSVDGAAETKIDTEDFVVTYNGKLYVIRAVSDEIISGDEVVIELNDGQATGVGVYEASLAGTLGGRQGGNYVLEASASRRYEIERAEHDLSKLKFADLEVTYDGKLHEIFVEYNGSKITNSTTVIDGSLTVTYSMTVELFNNAHTDSARTGNGGVAAGEYTITATFNDSDAANYVAIPDKVVVLSIKKADFFEKYNKEEMLGNFHNAGRGYLVNQYTKIAIDGKDSATDLSFNDGNIFTVTYMYEQWINGSYSPVFDGATQDLAAFAGVGRAGNYRIRARIDYVSGNATAEAFRNNYEAFEDIEISYAIANGTAQSISVEWNSDYDGHRYGAEFDRSSISSITVTYSNGEVEPFSGEEISGCVLFDGNDNEIITFGHVGQYNVKVRFLGVFSQQYTITVKQDISEITSWQYRVAGSQTWLQIPETGVEYAANGYEFRGVFACVDENGNGATKYVGATAADTLNVRENAYVLTAAKAVGNYVLSDGAGNALTGEVKIIKNTKESAKWYYKAADSNDYVEITDSLLVYNGKDYNGTIFAKYGDIILEWTIETDPEDKIVNAGEYVLTASQGNKAPNYTLQGLQKTIKINPQVLGENVQYAVEYEQSANNWVTLPEKLAYKGAEYAIRIKTADGKTIKVSGEGAESIRNAREYQLICGADNYVLPASKVLPKLTVTPVKITVTWSETTTFDYDGSEKSITAATDGAVGEDTDILVVHGNTGTDAMTYPADAAIADKYAGNYVIEDGETKGWSISPKEIEITWNATEFNYNGLPQTPVVASSNIEACDKTKIAVTYTYKYDGAEIGRGDIVGVDDKYQVSAVFTAAAGVDPSVMNNYTYSTASVSTMFSIKQAEPELGEVSYVEYASTNSAYVNYALRTDKIDYENKASIKGGFEFIDDEGNVLEEVKFITTGGQTVKLRFTPADLDNYKVKELELTVMVREDNPATGNGSLIVELAEGANQFIINTTLEPEMINVYQKYSSYYVENGVEHGKKQLLSNWTDLSLSINGKNAKQGYTFSGDDLPEDEDVGVVTLSAVLRVYRGSADITVSRLLPKSITIVNTSALKKVWYEGETFSFSDLRFTVTYTNNQTGSSPIPASMLTCEIEGMSGKTFTANDVGEKTVTFKYFDATATATINVLPKQELTVNYNKNGYSFGYKGGNEVDWKKEITFTDENKTAEQIGGIKLTYVITDEDGNTVTKITGASDREIRYSVQIIISVTNTMYKYTGAPVLFEVVVTNNVYEIDYDLNLSASYEYTGRQIPLPEGVLNSVTDRITGENVTAGVHVKQTIYKGTEEVEYPVGVGSYKFVVEFWLGEVGTGEKIGELQPLAFSVTQANNTVTPVAVQSIKVGESVNPLATAKFGEVKYQYSRTLNGTYRDYEAGTKFEEAGVYYMRAVVVGTDNYTGVTGTGVRFTVNEVSISNTEKTVEISDEVKGIEFGTTVATSALEDLSEIKVGNALAGYELTIDGNTQPLEGVTVKLLISDELKGRTDLNVYYVDADGNAKNMNAKVKGDYLVFTASGIGNGMLAVTARQPGQPVGLIVAVAILGAVAAGGMVACCVVFAKKRRSN